MSIPDNHSTVGVLGLQRAAKHSLLAWVCLTPKYVIVWNDAQRASQLQGGISTY